MATRASSRSSNLFNARVSLPRIANRRSRNAIQTMGVTSLRKRANAKIFVENCAHDAISSSRYKHGFLWDRHATSSTCLDITTYAFLASKNCFQVFNLHSLRIHATMTHLERRSSIQRTGSYSDAACGRPYSSYPHGSPPRTHCPRTHLLHNAIT